MSEFDEQFNGPAEAVFGGSPYLQGGDCGCDGTTGGAALSFLSGLTLNNGIKSALFIAAFIFLCVFLSDSAAAWSGWLTLTFMILYCIYDDLIATGLLSLGMF